MGTPSRRRPADAGHYGRHCGVRARPDPQALRGGHRACQAQGYEVRPPPALDEGERRVVAERYAKGATIVELAQEYEVGAGTIWRSLQSGKEASWQVSPTLAREAS